MVQVLTAEIIRNSRNVCEIRYSANKLYEVKAMRSFNANITNRRFKFTHKIISTDFLLMEKSLIKGSLLGNWWVINSSIRYLMSPKQRCVGKFYYVFSTHSTNNNSPACTYMIKVRTKKNSLIWSKFLTIDPHLARIS